MRRRRSSQAESLIHVNTILRNSWASLVTHLDAIEARGEDRDFDLNWEIEAIQEYAENILAASRLFR